MGKVFLIRHGEVDWNREASYVGATDLQLNMKGERQARELGEFLSIFKITALYSSPQSRAYRTAELLAQRLSLQIQIEPNLREANYGEWEGLTRAEVEERYPDVFNRWMADAVHVRIPGGENFEEVIQRAWPAFFGICKKHPLENIAVVAHKTVNRLILTQVLGMDANRYRQIGQNNACVNIIESRPNGTLAVEAINLRGHLSEETDIP